MAFDFSVFVLDGIMAGIKGGQSRFVITERAGAWMMQGVLTPEQMQQVSDALDAREAEAARLEAEREAAALAAKYEGWEITEEGLTARTIAELKQYMEDHGIATEGCELKADYVSAILESAQGAEN